MREIIEAIRRADPGYTVRSIATSGEGEDHVAYEINGELIVRRRKSTAPDEAAFDREAHLLAIVAEASPLPVPEVRFVDAAAGLIGLRKLPGESLLDHPPHAPVALADQLAPLLRALRAIPSPQVEGLVDHDDHTLVGYLDGACADLDQVAPSLPPAARRAVEQFLGRPPPPEPDEVVLCHNDLGAEHILADPATGRITGVIDWSDAALTDPARDLGRLYRDLGPATIDRILRLDGSPVDADGVHAAGDAVRQRAAFYARCTLLEDLRYGVETGDRRYADAALAGLDRTFAPLDGIEG